MNGEVSLGRNIYFYEGEKKEARIILHCKEADSGNCYKDELLIPGDGRHLDLQGICTEYVEMARSNKDWIIAKSIQLNDKKANYWIIDKRTLTGKSEIKSHVLGPFLQFDFRNKMKELKTGLDIGEDAQAD